MATNNRSFQLWFDLLPEMRQEIRARMPKISRFMLASTCNQERTLADKKTTMSSKKNLLVSEHPLVWQIRQTIIEDMEPLFEWLIQYLRIFITNTTENSSLHTVWARYIGTGIGKSGNLKWWVDDRLCTMLPRYIAKVAMVPLNVSNYSILDAPLAYCRAGYVPSITYGLAKCGHHNAFFDLYRMVTEKRFKLEGDDGYDSPENYQSPFLFSAARYGRLEWLQKLITTEFLSNNVHTPKVKQGVMNSAIAGGHLQVLKWFHSGTPNWFQETNMKLYNQALLISTKLPTEKLIEMITWLYTVARHPIRKGFLYGVVYRYLSLNATNNDNNWKVLELSRSMNQISCNKFNMTPDIRAELNTVANWIKTTGDEWLEHPEWRKQSKHPEWKTPWDGHPDLPAIPTLENMLDWIDAQIAKGRNNIK